MAVTRQSLEEYYRRLNDDELQRLLASNELTDLASQVAADELRHRGVALGADEPAAEPKEDEKNEIADVTSAIRKLLPKMGMAAATSFCLRAILRR